MDLALNEAWNVEKRGWRPEFRSVGLNPILRILRPAGVVLLWTWVGIHIPGSQVVVVSDDLLLFSCVEMLVDVSR